MIERSKHAADVQTVTLHGERYVILPEAEYRRLAKEPGLPALPPSDSAGCYPAVEYARASLARKIIRRRQAVGLDQAQLAQLAGLRVQTLSRIESGQVTPTVASIDKIDRALQRAETKSRKR